MAKIEFRKAKTHHQYTDIIKYPYIIDAENFCIKELLYFYTRCNKDVSKDRITEGGLDIFSTRNISQNDRLFSSFQKVDLELKHPILITTEGLLHLSHKLKTNNYDQIKFTEQKSNSIKCIAFRLLDSICKAIGLVYSFEESHKKTCFNDELREFKNKLVIFQDISDAHKTKYSGLIYCAEEINDI